MLLNNITSKELAWRIRRQSLDMAHLSHGSHIGSVLSIADILAVLYADILNVDPSQPKKETRDRFVLSKGHAGAGVYVALAESGFFSTEELKTHYADGSLLSGHVSHKVPGVELSTGSLGHGIGVAAGMAMAAKMNDKVYRVVTLLGDGECDEGSVWEAALFANHYGLNKLTVIIDHNKLQSLDLCEKTIALLDLGLKWKTFGWRVKEINGHDHDELKKALSMQDAEKPICIVAHTVKGKGVSFMENQVLWHYRDPQGEHYEKAVEELENSR